MKVLRALTVIGIGGGLIVMAVASLPRLRIAGPSTSVVRADGGCSAASLNGFYAYSAQGTLVKSILGLPAPAPWGEVTRLDFNGSGGFSALATVNVGGVALNSIPVTGTYTVNNNCTGSFTIPLNTQDTITEAVVLIGGGQGFVLTHTESFAVVTGRGERLGD